MEKIEFVQLMDSKVKLVRTEYGLTQEVMARILGISKKTLVEIEKRRTSMGWTNAVALASIFSDSTVIRDAIGEDVGDIIIALSFRDIAVTYPKTWGGILWWKTIKEEGPFRMQQNLLSRHYRILDDSNRRMYASFDLGETDKTLNELLQNKSKPRNPLGMKGGNQNEPME
jgi:DNA-binding XRE family transcriptional regulator